MSPSKTQTSDVTMVTPCSRMPFPIHTAKIVTSLQRCSKKKLGSLFSISGHLLDETYGLIQSWVPAGTTCGYHLYQGVAFDAIHELTKDTPEFDYLLANVRVLSALYGMIPLNTAVSPYRLDFTTRLWKKPSLLNFWKKTIQSSLASEDWILDAASHEYSALISGIHIPVVRVEFYQKTSAGLKVVSYLAKKLRGELIAWACQTQLSTPDQLIHFNRSGVHYEPTLSTPNLYCYVTGEILI